MERPGRPGGPRDDIGTDDPADAPHGGPADDIRTPKAPRTPTAPRPGQPDTINPSPGTGGPIGPVNLGTLEVGVRGATLASGYQDGTSYTDPGLGLLVRYRPVSAIGIELAGQHHSKDLFGDSNRTQTLGAASLVLFAGSDKVLSPYILGGATVNARNITAMMDAKDPYRVFEDSLLWGPHAGVGLHLDVAKTVGLDLEARGIGWMDSATEELSRPVSWTTGANLVFKF